MTNGVIEEENEKNQEEPDPGNPPQRPVP